MKFENGKYNDKVSGKLPEWRSSDGGFREKKATKDECLTGYQPTEREKKEHTAPRKVLDVENSYGTFSLGIAKDSKITTLTTQKRTKGIESLRGSEKELHSASATVVPGITERVRTNHERKEDSAVEYSHDVNRQSRFLLERMDQQLLDQKEMSIYEDIMPMLSVRSERRELYELREQRKQLLQHGGTAKDKSEIENQIEYLEANIRDKTMERKKMQTRLTNVKNQKLKENQEDFVRKFLHKLVELEEEQEDGREDEEDFLKK